MSIRLATEADLDAMTWVLVGASPHDPVYPYRFPNLYGDEFAELCAQKCAEYLATSTVVVCEMPVGGDATRTQVVAFSAWDCPQPAPKVRSSGTFPSVSFFSCPRPDAPVSISRPFFPSSPHPYPALSIAPQGAADSCPFLFPALQLSSHHRAP